MIRTCQRYYKQWNHSNQLDFWGHNLLIVNIWVFIHFHIHWKHRKEVVHTGLLTSTAVGAEISVLNLQVDWLTVAQSQIPLQLILLLGLKALCFLFALKYTCSTIHIQITCVYQVHLSYVWAHTTVDFANVKLWLCSTLRPCWCLRYVSFYLAKACHWSLQDIVELCLQNMSFCILFHFTCVFVNWIVCFW